MDTSDKHKKRIRELFEQAGHRIELSTLHTLFFLLTYEGPTAGGHLISASVTCSIRNVHYDDVDGLRLVLNTTTVGKIIHGANFDHLVWDEEAKRWWLAVGHDRRYEGATTFEVLWP